MLFMRGLTEKQRRVLEYSATGRWWCRERCVNGHEWTWLFEVGMPLGNKWPCGCSTEHTALVVNQWPEGCLMVAGDIEELVV